MREALKELCMCHYWIKSYFSTNGLMVLGMKISSLLGFSLLGAYFMLMYGRSMYFDSQSTKRIDDAQVFSNRDVY